MYVATFTALLSDDNDAGAELIKEVRQNSPQHAQEISETWKKPINKLNGRTRLKKFYAF